MSDKLRAAVIGCGSIGALKPEILDSPQTSFPLTHAHAYSMHPDFELAWVDDEDDARANEAARKWSCPTFNTKTARGVDVVSICTPDETHDGVIFDLLQEINPKVVICEKPMGAGTISAQSIVNECKAAGVSLAVGYTRRYVPELRRPWREDESPIMAFFHYGRGLRRDGCHAVDLARLWFGEFQCVMPNYISYDDACGETITRWAQFAACPVIFNAIPSKAYNVFDADIWTSQGLIQVRENGLRIERRTVAPEGRYGAYPALKSYCGEPIITGLPMAMLNMLDNVRDHIREGAPLLCTGQDAVENWKCIEALERHPLEGAR